MILNMDIEVIENKEIEEKFPTILIRKITVDQKRVIKAAASIEGINLQEFCLSAALEKSKTIVPDVFSKYLL